MQVLLAKRSEDELTFRVVWSNSNEYERQRQLFLRLPRRRWEPAERAWLVPYSLSNIDRLIGELRVTLKWSYKVSIFAELLMECPCFAGLEAQQAASTRTEVFE